MNGLRTLYQEHNKQPIKLPFMVEKFLDMPEFSAINLNVRLIFVIDNFHNLLRFDQNLFLFKKLKERWRRHKRSVYCLVGNKEHLNRKLIDIPRHPAHGFLKVMSLSWPGTEELKDIPIMCSSLHGMHGYSHSKAVPNPFSMKQHFE